MNKIILQAKNKKQLEEMIKNTVHLNEDEAYLIKEIKKPFNFLFITLNGKYEIEILKKSELKKIKADNIKETNLINKKEEKKVVKKEEKVQNFNVSDKLKKKIEEFVKKSELNIEVKNITRKDHLYLVDLCGKDVRYLIGEKGIALSSLEYLFNSTKELKGNKIIFDSNNYKSKREDSLKALAKKKAEKVLCTKTSIKLNPMTSRERRIIHEEISNYKNLKTESFGEDPKRYLVIKYIEKKED